MLDEMYKSHGVAVGKIKMGDAPGGAMQTEPQISDATGTSSASLFCIVCTTSLSLYKRDASWVDSDFTCHVG